MCPLIGDRLGGGRGEVRRHEFESSRSTPKPPKYMYHSGTMELCLDILVAAGVLCPGRVKREGFLLTGI